MNPSKTRPLTIVVSRGRSENPAKRRLEEDLATAFSGIAGTRVIVVPHLYDLTSRDAGTSALQAIDGDMVVLAWLYPRAAYWSLDYHNIRGRATTASRDGNEGGAPLDDRERVADGREVPSRRIDCLDLRRHDTVEPFVEAVRRIAAMPSEQVASPTDEVRHRPGDKNGEQTVATPEGQPALRLDQETRRRWYPVIDYSRCVNCMECIDFCLFGVYGIDDAETILVEQADNCRKGCPACSRVCPENAILFPQHKTPAIAGSRETADGIKIDLSQLFGAPPPDAAVADLADRERREQLALAAQEHVASAGEPAADNAMGGRPDATGDELDQLIDQLDQLEP